MGGAGQPQKRGESGQTVLNDGMRQRRQGVPSGKGDGRCKGLKAGLSAEHAGLSAEQS